MGATSGLELGPCRREELSPRSRCATPDLLGLGHSISQTSCGVMTLYLYFSTDHLTGQDPLACDWPSSSKGPEEQVSLCATQDD